MTRRRRSSLSPLSTPPYEEKDVKVLRIAASEVAAIAGFHEWVDVRELFVDRLLYQDLEHVLHADADNLGLELEDRRQRSERLLAKTGDVELQTVRERAGNASAVATVRDAKALRDKAKSLLKKAEGSKKLSKEEARELEDDLRHDINTQFGTRNEEVALRVYERRSGTEVMCSNDRYLIWPFPGARHGDGIPDGALDPPEELAKGWNKTRNRRLKHARFASQAAAQTVVAADPDPSFAPAVARCLTELPVRAVLEGVIERVLSIASATDVETVSAAVDLSEKVEGVKGVHLSLDKGEGGVLSVPASNGDMENGNRRQLAPGVPWPEWRRGVSPAEGGGSSVDAQGGRWCGQPGLWFPESLTPRQRDAVRTTAAELGLGRDLVAGKAVVVWEDSAKGAAAVAAATASVAPEATRSARRTLALPSCARSGSDGQCMSLLGDAGAPSIPGQGQSLRDGPNAVVEPEARKSAGCGVSERATGGRGSGSLRASDGDSDVDVMCKIAGRSSMAVSEAITTKGEVGDMRTSVPYQTIIPSVSGAADIAEAAAAALMCPEIGNGVNQGEAGVEVVYAWGEGPASAVATTSDSASTQEPEESSLDDTLGVGLSTAANQTPSVWCRKPHVGTPEAEKIVAELPVTRRASMMSDFSDGREGVASEEAGGAMSAGEGKVGENAGVDDKKKACFVIVGAVDGVAEELTTAEEDADSWETRRVVVEVKNRMNKALDPPPLYDQIQLVTYMLMIGATAGDLVQFVKTQPRSKKGRDRNRGSSAEETGLDKAAGGTEALAEEDVTISRVELDCRRYHHKRHWQGTILPRLYAFARMVYRFRSDDLLRWRYLLATPEEQREMLVECCPYLADVIKQTLPRASPTVRDVVGLEQKRGETIAACPSSETSSGAASRKQKRGRENGIGYDSVNSPESVESGSSAAAVSAVSPLRKRGRGEEGVTLERVGVISHACKGK